MKFDTKVAGIPCQCEVTSYSAGTPARVTGPWEDCYPEEPAEFEFRILDRRGRPAAWLEKKVTDEDKDRLLEEYQVTLLEHKHYYDERD